MKRKSKIVFLAKKEEEVFVLLGQRTSGGETFWWLPGGSVEEGETDYEGAVRELNEELFLPEIYTNKLNQFFLNQTVPTFFEYETEKAHNILFMIPCETIFLENIPTIQDEFDNLAWWPVLNLPENMSKEFINLKENWGNLTRI